MKILEDQVHDLQERVRKLEEKSKHEGEKCDVCGRTPSVIITTGKGTFCQDHIKYI